MNVLVIGGAGYIGSTLCRDLWEHGHHVTALDLLLFGGESLVPLLGKPRFRLVPDDLRNEETLARLMPGQDAVVLLAAIVGEPACNRDSELAVDINLHGARKVQAAARAAGVERFVFASTCSNYGVSDSENLVDETAPLQPLSTYSETKVAFEQELLSSNGGAFHPTVLRFSTAFGVSARMRFDLLVSDFARAAVCEKKIVIFGEQFWRPFVHIADIAKSVRMVLEADASRVSGEVFNVGSNEANTQKEQLGRSVQQHVPGTELEFVKRDYDPRSYRVDFTKIHERLGFVADWSLDDGIREVQSGLEAGIWKDPYESRYQN
jgi:nucleoside-diphosphate-sugar epimerase